MQTVLRGVSATPAMPAMLAMSAMSAIPVNASEESPRKSFDQYMLEIQPPPVLLALKLSMPAALEMKQQEQQEQQQQQH